MTGRTVLLLLLPVLALAVVIHHRWGETPQGGARLGAAAMPELETRPVAPAHQRLIRAAPLSATVLPQPLWPEAVEVGEPELLGPPLDANRPEPDSEADVTLGLLDDDRPPLDPDDPHEWPWDEAAEGVLLLGSDLEADDELAPGLEEDADAPVHIGPSLDPEAELDQTRDDGEGEAGSIGPDLPADPAGW